MFFIVENVKKVKTQESSINSISVPFIKKGSLSESLSVLNINSDIICLPSLSLYPRANQYLILYLHLHLVKSS